MAVTLNNSINNHGSIYGNMKGINESIKDEEESYKELFCTDGNDDGSIDASEICDNLHEGAKNTLIKTMESCFLDDNGKFSISRAALTTGVAALCFLFPPVGVTLCAVGIGAGAVQMGKGVYDAMTAKNDADAKKAWQEIGGGAFVTTTSAFGAKLGVNSVKNSVVMERGASAINELSIKNANFVSKEGFSAISKDSLASFEHGSKILKGNVITQGLSSDEMTFGIVQDTTLIPNLPTDNKTNFLSNKMTKVIN